MTPTSPFHPPPPILLASIELPSCVDTWRRPTRWKFSLTPMPRQNLKRATGRGCSTPRARPVVATVEASPPHAGRQSGGAAGVERGGGWGRRVRIQSCRAGPPTPLAQSRPSVVCPFPQALPLAAGTAPPFIIPLHSELCGRVGGRGVHHFPHVSRRRQTTTPRRPTRPPAPFHPHASLRAKETG